MSSSPETSPEIVGRRHARIWRRRQRAGPFGRGPVREVRARSAGTKFSDDVKLFATTFAAGFLVVSIFIG